MKQVMKRLSLFFRVLFLGSLLAACSKEEEEQSLDFGPCDCGNPTLETVTAQVGEVAFNNELNKYVIHWAIPGTIDSKKLYFLCRVPARFEQAGVRVRFSGEAKAPCKQPTSNTGAQQFYDIRLTQLEME
jgi:hypothetical protein